MRLRLPTFGIKNAALGLLLAIAPQIAFCQQVKIVSYNIWGLPAPLMRHPERFNDLSKAINSLDADIVLIQEAFTNKAEALTRLSRFPYYAWGPSSRFMQFNSGLLILSKYPIAEKRTTVYSKCGGFDCFANKGAQFARILLPDGKMIGVFNTHLNANGHSSARYTQAAELITFVRRYSNGLPSIVGGDLNGDKRPFVETFVRNLFAKDSHAEFVETHPNISKEISQGFTADPIHNPFLPPKDPCYRLDHIFLVDGTRAQKLSSSKDQWKVVNDELIFNGKGAKILSDHFGIRITADLNSTRYSTYN